MRDQSKFESLKPISEFPSYLEISAQDDSCNYIPELGDDKNTKDYEALLESVSGKLSISSCFRLFMNRCDT